MRSDAFELKRNAFQALGSQAPRLSLNLNIYGTPLRVLLNDSAMAAELRYHFREFLTPATGFCFTLQIETSADERLWDDEDAEFYQIGEWVTQRDFIAKETVSELGEPSVLALIHSEGMDSVHNLLRWYLSSELISRDCLLLHGAGVVKNGLGYIFFGPSGAGKSTSVALIEKADSSANRLGDDSVILKMATDSSGKKSAFLCSAPLGCGYSLDAPPKRMAPLAGIFRLVQDQRTFIEEISLSESASHLVANTMHSRSDLLIERGFQLASELHHSGIQVQKIHFEMNSKFWSVVQEFTSQMRGECDVRNEETLCQTTSSN